MSFYESFASDASRNLVGTLRQVTSAGAVLNVWNKNTSQWEATVTAGNRQITATEPETGSYLIAVAGALGTYTGFVELTIQDSDQSDLTIGKGRYQFENGDIVLAPTPSELTAVGVTATASQVAAESVDTKLTSARAGYLDNLSAGAAALESSVQSISSNIVVDMDVAPLVEIPESGTTTVRVDLLLQNKTGGMTGADSTPTITASNSGGTDRSVNLSAVTAIATGHYRVTYSVASTHAEELITVNSMATVGGVSATSVRAFNIVSVPAGGGFSTSDRSNLDTITAKLPSASYLVGTTDTAGNILLDTAVGDKTAYQADETVVAAAVDVDLTAAHGSGAWNTASDATLAKQNEILTQIAGVVPSPASPVQVNRARTWMVKKGIENDRAPQVVTLASSTQAVLSMDFSHHLNPGTGITAVSSVTDLSGNGLVPTDLAPSGDRQAAHFSVASLTAGERHEFETVVTTSDNETLTGRGVLQVEG